MATSNNLERNDDVTSGELNVSSNQPPGELSDIAARVNPIVIQQTGDQPQVAYNTFQIAAGVSSLPGTLDPETLKMKLSETNTTFVPTRTFKDISRSLENNCHVTICGASGEGKTTMALMLGRKYRKQGYELVFVDRPGLFDLGSCISAGQKVCLIFDDIFGSVGQSTDITDVQRLCDTLQLHIKTNLKTRLIAKTDMNKHGQEQVKKNNKGFHKAKTTNSKEIRVIFTSKTYDFKEGVSKMQYQRISMFTKSVVDLTVNHGSPYSQPEKKDIFHKHRELHPERKLGNLEVEELIKQDSSLFGFPLTCRLFFEFSAFTEKAVDFFKRPLYYLRIELNNILSRRNEQGAALVLVLLCEENVKLPELESPTTNEKVEQMVKLLASFTNSVTPSGIAGAARSFRGTFLSRGDNLCFAHSSIYEACACALYQFNPTFVLQYCSLDFLYERLKPGPVDESGVSDQLHYLFVSEEYFPLLVTRFVSSMKDGIFSKTVAHPMMQNESFVRIFLEEIGKLAINNKAWIQGNDSEKGFLYWIVKSEGVSLVQNIENALQITFTPDDIREALLASVECDSLTIFKHLMGKLAGKLDKSDMNMLLLTSAKSSGEEMVKYLLHMGANISTADKIKRTFIHLLCIYDRPTILKYVTTQAKKEDLDLAMTTLDEDRRTPLMVAALYGTWDCFKLIMSEVKTSVNECESLIHLACEGGNKEIVKSVLTPQNLNSRGLYGRTPMMVAAHEAKSDIFDLRLSHKADVTLVDEYGNKLLHHACAGGNKHIVERVLTPQNLNSSGQYGRTPIMAAFHEAKSDIFDLLLSHNADVTLVDDDGDTLLHYACCGGNKHIVERVLTPQNLNSSGHYGRTPIMAAAHEAKSDIFDLLLSHGADVTLVDDDGDTLLHYACYGGNKPIVERVLTPKNLNSSGHYGRTPIMAAAHAAKSDIFDLLLSHNADVTLVGEFGNTLLHYACYGGNKPIVERVLTPQNLNSSGQYGRTPIMAAAHAAKSDIFDLLLSHNADVTLVGELGNTLLHYACYGGNKHIVERVLTPQNLNSSGHYGRTPIMVAAHEAKSDIFDLLLSHGADFTLVDDDGNSLLHYACYGGNKHIVESVLTPHTLNSRGQDGRTPIMAAAHAAKSDIFDLLLSHNADVTLVGEFGNTLLHYACYGGNKHIVERVLTPQNLNSSGHYGITPIMAAAHEAKSDIFDLLLSHGADVTLVGEFGNTLLHYACYGGNKHIVERVLTPQNLNSSGQYGRTPIMAAAHAAKSDIFDLLLSHNADVTLVGEFGNTLLHYACYGGNKPIVERVLTPQNLNSSGHYGRTPIMAAAHAAKSDIFDLLLSHNADVTLVDEYGNKLLHHACAGGNTNIVERVLTPQNLNSSGQYGRTPIMAAAHEAKSDIFDLLLSHNADVTLVDDDGDTLLHYACYGGNKHIVERVLTPQNLNSSGQYGRTPIMAAAHEAKSDIFDLLLSHGADVTLVDDDGDTLLHYACAGGNKHIVERVLTPQNLNSSGQYGRTPIMAAAHEAKSDIFDLLLSHDADVTLVGEFGNTLLHYACYGGNKHIVERVLTPQNLNSSGQYGRTPIMAAAHEAKSDIFDLLLSHGADVTLVDDDGDTLLHYACYGGNKHIVERVLTPQNLNSSGQYGRTPIMAAAHAAKSDIFDLLLSHNADVTLVGELGNTLLHYACYGGNKHIVERVLTPQNLNSSGHYGRTPIMVAAHEAKSDIFDLLLSHGADFTLDDDNGNSLLHYACYGGNKHIVESVLTPHTLNSRGQDGRTPIMAAAHAAKSDIFDLLLSHNADVTLVGEFGNTLLHYACYGGDKHIVERVLTPQNLNSSGHYGITAIMAAAHEAKSDIFDLLLSHGADVTLVGEFGNTLLHYACYGGNKHIVERVLTPQNLNSSGQYGRTPIMAAAHEAKSDIFDLLLSHNADVTLVDDDGDTLLHYACYGGNKHIVERVLTPQNLNSSGQYGRTPIMAAAHAAKSDIFDLLLSHNADVTLVGEFGNTLLHYACYGGNKPIVERVLTPQNLNSSGHYGRTPIMAAAHAAKSDIFDLLLSHNADVTLVDEYGNKLLHHACAGGNTNIVERVLTPQNLNSSGQYGRTPIMAAAHEAKSDIFDLLLSHNADVTLVDDDGDTLLHYACYGGNKHIVERVLTPQNLNSSGQYGRTPIMAAAHEAKSDIFDLLLSHGADVTLVDDDGDTLLHYACYGGNKHIVERVLTPQNLNSSGQYGRTPIMAAAHEAKSDIFDLLLSHDADVTLVGEFGNTLLHYACYGGNKHIVERVLTPQNLNSSGQYGRTPIMAAAHAAKSDIFDLLLSHGADVTLVGEFGNTLLHYACYGGNKHIVERVLTPQNLNSSGHYGMTPIMAAAHAAKSDIFDLLLSHGADVTLVGEFGNTLLHYACYGGNKHIVERVLTPQNLNSSGRYGRTPIMVAACGGKSDIYDFLLSHGADLTLVDEDGDTLLHLACVGGNTHIVESVLTPQNLNSKGHYGWTPIMVAAHEDKANIFDLLLFQGADVTLVDDYGNTLLHCACAGGNKHIIDNVQTSHNLNSSGQDGSTQVMVEGREEHIEINDFSCEKGTDQISDRDIRRKGCCRCS